MASGASTPAAPVAEPRGGPASGGKDPRPRYVEVESTLEFSRLVCALERVPRVSFLHVHGGRPVLSAQVDILDDTPVIYYAPLGEGGNGGGGGHYLSYALRDGREESRMVEAAGDASSTYSPIVRVRSLPASLRPGSGTGESYHPIVLEDLASLARLSYAFEDSPFPLFAFPRGGGWLVGMFMTFSEDGASYFCHVRSGERPGGPFLRFSPSNGVPASFVGTPDEHGYNYAKVITLRGEHPLVDYAQV